MSLLLLFGGLICGYAFLTDDARVREQAETYLSRLVGGPVTVEEARLSLFEGLRIEGVKASVDELNRPDSTIFTARSVEIGYDPLTLLTGRLEATRVVAIDPRVHLVEDENGRWNFQRRRTGRGGRLKPPDSLPEILLRNAQVELGFFQDGELRRGAEIGIEAQLTPTDVRLGELADFGGASPRPVSTAHFPSARTAQNEPETDPESPAAERVYAFAIQARGLGGERNPRADGYVDLRRGRVWASLGNVEFGDGMLSLLPIPVRQWWQRHEIAGRLDVPAIAFDFGPDFANTIGGRDSGTGATFRVEVALDDVTMKLRPEEWLEEPELSRQLWLTDQLHRGAAHLLAFDDSPLQSSSTWGEAFDQPDRPALLRKLDQWTHQAANALRHDLGRILVGAAEGTRLAPIPLDRVSGRFVFTQENVVVRNLVGSIAGNTLRFDGVVGGYSVRAPGSMVIQTLPDAPLTIPARVANLAALPRPVREIYFRFKPIGSCHLRLEVDRPRLDDGSIGRPVIGGSVTILDGTFELDRFPYPLRDASGKLILGLDHATGQDRLVIENLVAKGMTGGPNANATVTINGLVQPLNSIAGFDVTIVGNDVSLEPAVLRALPRPTQQAIQNFDSDGPGPLPHFAGDFVAHISRPAGAGKAWDFGIDLFLRELKGALEGFPYPLRDATAELRVRPDHVQLVKASMRRGDATVGLHGRIEWGRRPGDPDLLRNRPLRYDLTLDGNTVPLDETMLTALPDDVAERLRSLGIGGRSDVSGRIFTDDNDTLDWDLKLQLQDGRFWPEIGTFSLTDVAGTVRVTRKAVELQTLTARRGEAAVKVSGTIGVAGQEPQAELAVAALDLMLDPGFYDLLPSAAQDAWDWLRPQGKTDLAFLFRGPVAVLAGEATSEQQKATQFAVQLNPKGVAVRPTAIPYPLTNVQGEIRITPGRIELQDVQGERTLTDKPPATVLVNGTGLLGEAPGGGDVWDLTAAARNVPADDVLIKALPPTLGEGMTSLHLDGTLGMDLSSLRIVTRPTERDAIPAAATRESTAGEANLDLDFDGTFTLSGGAMDVGVKLGEMDGSLDLKGGYRAGELRWLDGSFRSPQFTLSGRDGTDLAGKLRIPEGSNELKLLDLSGKVAGGSIGGWAGITYPDKTDPNARDESYYAVNLVLRDASVKQLTGELDQDVSGSLTASVNVEGFFGDAASRRGRGDVLVVGKQLYRLPMVLGLLQFTNLALPITEPFGEATAGFSVDGQTVHVEHIQLKARDMVMHGSGSLDFGTEKVDLTFTTSNHGWAAIPVVGELIGAARNELIRVRIRGTLEQPKVSGQTLPTITSTIDEVFRD